MKGSICRFALAVIMSATVSGAAEAQTFLFKSVPEERPQIGLRFLRPSLDSDVDLSAFSGIYDVSLSLPVNERWSIDASFPYSRYAFGEGDDSESFIGNLYAGLQHLTRSGNVSRIVSFGAYIPTADDDLSNLIFGMFTNYEDLFKYYPDAWTFYGNFAYFNITQGGARLGLEVGPDLLVPTGDGGDDAEFLMHYGITAGYQGEMFAAFTELIGLAMLTEDYDDFSDRFTHSIDFGLSYVSPRFMPGVFYKIYLKDEFRDMVDGVLGVTVKFVM
jgi:hypothetical protein